MIEIDGSKMEGGGQIVRTGVGMSALTGKPVRLYNIRKGRCASGLAEQHLCAVKAVANLCNAQTEGVSLGSHEITFKPGEINRSKIKVEIRTAGSICLVLQALSIPLLKTTKKVEVEFVGGATAGKWAPPIDYFENVTCPVLEKWGVTKPVFEIIQRGFYPRGGAKVKIIFKPSQIHSNNLLERGKIKEVKGISVASKNLEGRRVAERQKKGALKEMIDYQIKVKTVYAQSDCPGTVVNLWAETENTVIGANQVGDKKTLAETVGRNAAKKLLKELDNKACVDEHMTDQVLPILALAGGAVKIPKVTSHAETNMWVIEKFVGKKFEVKNCVVRA
ncbi:MAG: RNA 3'-terminal phosphate cyclase [Nanoarchaeota archaeon]|nr:RNA 3'-terminal phosphate cyclase [Nanoarchaeota archaeon]